MDLNKDPKFIRQFLLITLIHFIFYVFTLIWTFGPSLSQALDGQAMSLFDRILDQFNAILALPLMPLIQNQTMIQFPGLLGYLPIVLNSMVWGIILIMILNTIARKRE